MNNDAETLAKPPPAASLEELRARRPLRLVHVNSADRWVGEAAHSVELCAGLAERGHSVLWCGRAEAPVIESARQAGLDTLGLSLPSRFAWLRELDDLRALRGAIAERQADALHAHRGKDHWVAAATLLRWRKRRVPPPLGQEPPPGTLRPAMFRTRHVVVPARLHPFNRWINTRATCQLLAVSESAARSMGPYWDKARARKIILSGVDLERFSPRRRDLDWKERELGVPREAPLIGLVGRVQRVKGQHVFLEAAKIVAGRFPQAHFFCAGSTRNQNRAQSLAEQGAEALGGRWRLLGHVEEIETLMATMDAGVIASLGSEGSSRATLEYLASGLPVLASEVGGIPDVLRAAPRLDLRLFEPGNAQRLAEMLIETLEKLPSPSEPRAGYPAEDLAPISRERWLDEFERNYYEQLFQL